MISLCSWRSKGALGQRERRQAWPEALRRRERGRARAGTARCWRIRSSCTSFGSSCSPDNGAQLHDARRRSQGDSRSSATCRSSWRSTPPTCGRIRDLFLLDAESHGRWWSGWRSAGLLLRGPASSGETRLYDWEAHRTHRLHVVVQRGCEAVADARSTLLRLDHFRGFEAGVARACRRANGAKWALGSRTRRGVVLCGN